MKLRPHSPVREAIWMKRKLSICEYAIDPQVPPAIHDVEYSNKTDMAGKISGVTQEDLLTTRKRVSKYGTDPTIPICIINGTNTTPGKGITRKFAIAPLRVNTIADMSHADQNPRSAISRSNRAGATKAAGGKIHLGESAANAIMARTPSPSFRDEILSFMRFSCKTRWKPRPDRPKDGSRTKFSLKSNGIYYGARRA